MRINLEINGYNTSIKLIFYENDRSLLQAFDNITCRLHEANNTKKNEIDCLILIVDDVYHFDRLKEKRNFLSYLI